MKNAWTVMAALWLCVSLSTGLLKAAETGGQAGAAKVDITPQRPIRLSGYGARTDPSEGVEDPIFARALALKDPDGVLTVLVSVDSVGVPEWVRERVLDEIRGRLGIYHVRLAICSTHTHTGPSIADSLKNLLAMSPDETETVRAYSEELVARLVKAIEGALQKLQPARLVHGQGSAGFARNRRKETDPVEHQLPVLAALDARGKPIAIVFNYACHATTLSGEFNRVSGDWPGYAAAFIDAAYPGAVTLPLIGCGADANPHPRGKLEEAKEHGREIAGAVEKVLSGPVAPLPAKIDAQLEYVNLRFGQLPDQKVLEERLKDKQDHVRRHARHQLDRIAREGRLPQSLPYPIQVLSFGDDLTMVILAGEVVADYAIRLRREIPGKDLWITSYANDVPAYIASRRVLSEGGYEADDSMLWYDQPARWDPSVEDTIVEKAKLLVELSGASGAALSRRVKPPPPVPPEKALATFRVAEGFRLELAAAEPEVTDPVAIAFDEKGRLYAAEMRDYPLGPGEGKPFDGRIRLLEDADGDGRFERSTVFAENVPYPNGIACSKGGVYVTCAPDLIYLKDTDGDGRADVRQVVYTGFNLGNSQHLLNTIKWGLDNRLYVNGGDSASIRCPLDPKVPALALDHSSFRFDPRTLAVEATTGYRGGYSLSFDSAGARFVCDNQTHVVHVALGERRYLARNPDLAIGDTMQEITDHGARVYPISKPLERFNDPLDSGRFSSACGVHVYAGDQFPEAYRGSHFVCEPVSNLVHRDVLEPSGASFTARRGEKDSEFLASSDHWFRPVSCDTGPDGCLYVVDMYREVIEHPEWIPLHMQKLFDLRSGMDRGRIYRVVHGKGPERKRFDLSRATPEELVARLSDPSGWWRMTAQRLLVERRESPTAPAIESAVRKGFRESREVLGRLHALWTLEGLGAAQREELSTALRDPAPAVRAAGAEQAARLIEALSKEPAVPDGGLDSRTMAEVIAGLRRLADDPDPRVRFQAALSLGALKPDQRKEPLEKIALADAADPWTRIAVLTSTADPLGLLSALEKAGLSRPGQEELVQRLASLIGTRARAAEVCEALRLLAAEAASDPARRLPALTTLLSGLGAGGLRKSLEAGGSAAAGLPEKLSALFQAVSARARDEGLELGDRTAAVDLLGFDGSQVGLKLLQDLLDPRYPTDLQKRAVASLWRLPEPAARAQVSAFLLKTFATQTPQVRGEVLDGFLADTERMGALLEAIENREIRAGEVDLTRRKRLLESSSDDIKKRAGKVFADLAADPDRAAVVARFQKVLDDPRFQGKSDPRKGEELFLKNCSKCHRAGERGNVVGADLSGMRSRSAEALLVDILDPSRAVSPEFVNYLVVTRDRRLLNGILASETPASVTLRREEGKTDTILRRDIAELRSTFQSLMPEGLEKELGAEGLRDVIAFVRSGLLAP